jgi:uncharacterized protein YgbK (DUF1537 family)
MKLGCIADDFTGATDLAGVLAAQGMRTLLVVGLPIRPPPADAEAVVIALKTRTAPPREAVRESLQALEWLHDHGAQQVFFKVCSTFDSTPAGNIGPVAEALMEALDARIALVTPAYPDNGRTVYMGHLFVGDQLLHESGLQHHPLTPMTDANLVRVLQAQCRRRVGLVDHRVVTQGPGAVQDRLAELEAAGAGLAIADATCNDDLLQLGAAVPRLPLLVGGSGLALGLPANWGLLPDERAAQLPPAQGAAAIVAGSCSAATQRQMQHFIAQGGAALALDPLRMAEADLAAQALAWAEPHLPDGPVLLYSTADAAGVQRVQGRLGVEAAGALVEGTLAAIARGLVRRGVGRLVVAGGETSGACVQALGVRQLRIGAAIAPGVPWCHTECPAAPEGLHLALKSGNFGADDFFTQAFEVLP